MIMQQKFVQMIQTQESLILKGISDFVFFFFGSRNINISPSVTAAYARFILKNIRNTLEKSILSHPDADLLTKEDPIVDMDLF